jgi:hypothetical protein
MQSNKNGENVRAIELVRWIIENYLSIKIQSNSSIKKESRMG